MKRQKRATKKERKALDPTHRAGPNVQAQHIHCISCGRHLDPSEFDASPASATLITCDHGSRFASCVACMQDSERRVVEHDRSGEPVRTASAWH
ncbi:MAG: hypothetical protein KF718_17500 [Polyangiaceae bacterium]|nr:hypothetical protein [Polyangiaceae bacterium]